jgi:hypothetical protein
MSKLKKAVEAVIEDRQRKKREGINAWQKKKAEKASAKKVEETGLFNVKKYDCWLFPSNKLEVSN